MNVHQYHPDDVVPTAIGPMRVGDMTKRLYESDTETDCASVREFWYGGQCVKREASVQMKYPGVESKGLTARFKGFLRQAVIGHQPPPPQPSHQENLS